MALREKTVAGANQFSDAIVLVSYFNLSISGTWAGTVTIQRSFDDGSTWHDVDTWATNTQEYGFEPEKKIKYRVGIKAGDYTSGTCVLRLSN